MKAPMEGTQVESMYAGDCASDQNFKNYFDCLAATTGGTDAAK
jgi:hypothetical protein